MKRVLITGGAGFIGYHLATELVDNGYAVDLVDNFSRAVADPDLDALAERPHVRLIRGDVLDRATYDALGDDYAQIYHFAAIIGVAHVMNRPYDVLRDNTAMLVLALEFARRQGSLERFVFASTSEVYAGTLQYFTLPIPTPEDSPLALTPLDHPRTSYMLSKIYGEALCQHSNVPFTIIRPHNFFGPRMGLSHVVPELLKKAYEAEPGTSLTVASVEHRRAFCYISDAVHMIRLLAESDDAKGQTVNVGNQEQELSIGELARLVIEVVGRDLDMTPGPQTPGSPSRRSPEMSRAIGLTGFSPRVGLREGVTRTFDWYKHTIFDGGVASAR